jgi:serine/threonine protein phosphatase 1
MFDALEDLELFGDWLRLGGLATVASFGVAPDPEYDDAALLGRWQKKAGDFIRLFCRRLAPIHAVGDYLFVHAGLRPGLPLWEQRLSDLTLIREPFLSADHDFGPMVVHGHTPVAEVDFRRHRVNIDTGAYATGRLSCLVLQGEERRVLT